MSLRDCSVAVRLMAFSGVQPNRTNGCHGHVPITLPSFLENESLIRRQCYMAFDIGDQTLCKSLVGDFATRSCRKERQIYVQNMY